MTCKYAEKCKYKLKEHDTKTEYIFMNDRKIEEELLPKAG